MNETYTLDDHVRYWEKHLRSRQGWAKLLARTIGLDELQRLESHNRRIKAIVQSMTPAERASPESIDAPRRDRIAKGCGADPLEVDRLLTMFGCMSRHMGLLAEIEARAGTKLGVESSEQLRPELASARQPRFNWDFN